MLSKIRSLLKNRTRRYIVTGVAVYIVELIIIVAVQALGASTTLAVGISFWIGLFLSFMVQKLFTFQDKRMHHKILVPQLIAVTLLVLFNFGFTLFATYLLNNKLPAVLIRTLALGATTIWNFYIYRTRIFKKDDSILID